MRQKIALFLLFLSISLFGESKESYYDKARKEMVRQPVAIWEEIGLDKM